MAKLEDLTKKIIDDGNETVEEILEQALDQARQYDQKIMKDANEKYRRNLQIAEEDGEHLFEQICSMKEMELRDKNLFVKEQILDQVFEQAYKQLQDLSFEEFLQFVTLNLSFKELEGYTLIIPERYLQDHESEIKKEIKASGVVGDYTLASGKEHGVTDGFILTKDGIEENHTFASWIRELRQDMEGEILDILYERG